MFSGFQTLLEYTYQIVLWCIPQILLDFRNLSPQKPKTCMVSNCLIKLVTNDYTDLQTPMPLVCKSHIEPEKRSNVQSYYGHAQGIMTDTHALIKEDLQSWDGVRGCDGRQHIAPAIVQYHEFFALLGPFVPHVVEGMQGAKHVMQHIRLDRSIKLTNFLCINQTKTFHFDILSLLLTEQFCIDLAITLKKTFLLAHPQFQTSLRTGFSFMGH